MGRRALGHTSLIQHGVLPILVLSAIQNGLDYCYTIHRSLIADGLYLSEGTIYTALQRYEVRGLLTSDGHDAKERQRRHYRLTEKGRTALMSDLRDWAVATRRLELASFVRAPNQVGQNAARQEG